jgi:hypothetical protein
VTITACWASAATPLVAGLFWAWAAVSALQAQSAAALAIWLGFKFMATLLVW